MSKCLGFIVCIILFASCSADNYVPKPKAYPRVKFPTSTGYKKFDNGGPYTFEYPVYAKAIADTNFFNAKPENPWWLNIYYPDFNAQIYISYKEINNNENTFYKLLEDTYQLTFKHTVKADAIDRTNFNPAPKVAGQMFTVHGNAASANQFYITDSTQHFVRGSLYFYCEPNEDSLAPITKFVFNDIAHIISTFRWTR